MSQQDGVNELIAQKQDEMDAIVTGNPNVINEYLDRARKIADMEKQVRGAAATECQVRRI